ncbi:MAG: YigZ family protein [Clostridiales bacterium]|nr:YigZ family protein [Clostridiales bacterium]
MADDSFITLSKKGSSLIEIKGSEFIGRAMRVDTPEQAEDFVRNVRAEYPDARHTCYAWTVDGATHMQKYSDDGEPSGTGGLPILSVLTKGGITNAVITVTRYFGGILLGKGGLVRAYTDSAAEAVKDAVPVKITTGQRYLISCGYDMSEKILFALKANEWQTGGIDYSDRVQIECMCSASESEKLIETVRDLSAGRVIPEKTGECELMQKPSEE